MNRVPSRILVVDDEPLKRAVLEDGLVEAGYRVSSAAHPLAAEPLLAAQEFDLVLTDLRMPGQDGLSFLRTVKHRWPARPVLVMTAYGTVESAVQAMKLGAFDYIQKPFSTPELLLKLDRALRFEGLSRENEELRRRLAARAPETVVVGHSPAIQRLLERVHAVAGTDATVLLQGESGTGKSLVAQLIHETSHRAAGPFITVSCAALPRDLIESELFGHEPGAFTGALRQRAGRFELAHGGTLFLDDVDDIPLEVQVRLLRVLQDRVFERVGGERLHQVNVRVVAATKKVLHALVAQERFREDLYYRLNVVPMEIPPLRERLEDVPLLVEHILRRLAERFLREPPVLSPAALERLRRYHWPGNVRELEHILEQMIALCPAAQIGPEQLPLSPERPGTSMLFALNLEHVEHLDYSAVLGAFDTALIRWALTRADGNLARAAELLGLARSTLQYKVQKLEA